MGPAQKPELIIINGYIACDNMCCFVHNKIHIVHQILFFFLTFVEPLKGGMIIIIFTLCPLAMCIENSTMHFVINTFVFVSRRRKMRSNNECIQRIVCSFFFGASVALQNASKGMNEKWMDFHCNLKSDE